MHGEQCLNGCLPEAVIKAGSILRFSTNSTYPAAGHCQSEHLVVTLREMELSPGVKSINDLIHCCLISRSPSKCSTRSLHVRQVSAQELDQLQKRPQSMLFMTEDPASIQTAGRLHFNWSFQECIEPAAVKRIPQKCLHVLPLGAVLQLADSSLKSLLRQVEDVARALGKPKSTYLKELDNRQQEDVITLQLLRLADRMRRPSWTPPRKRSQETSSTEAAVTDWSSRRYSIWEHGDVPRNGGQ